ncbi:MAG: ergothioneine biosynthesis protein EgtB [Spirulina sp. SIO3F2]|nr:ergothioneine biosynthesis protein EgtB [Spirulina sp. SIO3F2]
MSKAHPFKRNLLQADMRAARAQTLQLFADVDDTTFCQQIHPDFSPVGWHLGHIAFTEALWILEHCAGQPMLAPDYRRLFTADGLSKVERQNLPPKGWILNYLETVRSRVLDYLNIAPLTEQARLWYWLLQHESQHNETISFLLHLHQGQSNVQEELELADPDHDRIKIPASYFVMGSDRLEAQDNERPPREVWVETFTIDRYPVTCAQYQAFIDAGGYQKSDYWSAAGWTWRSQQHITQPLYWQRPEHRKHHPVYGVSHYEAAAYAQWAGKRLPTEVEWEKAACWKPGCPKTIPYPWGKQRPAPQHCNYSHHIGYTTPVNAYPQGQSPSGCWDMLGNVWEWTASDFRGYDGFAAYPYRGYSAAYFDGQHRVMRGGSWATRQWGLRGSFRNWYHPWVREIFVGFRCAL